MQHACLVAASLQPGHTLPLTACTPLPSRLSLAAAGVHHLSVCGGRAQSGARQQQRHAGASVFRDGPHALRLPALGGGSPVSLVSGPPPSPPCSQPVAGRPWTLRLTARRTPAPDSAAVPSSPSTAAGATLWTLARGWPCTARAAPGGARWRRRMRCWATSGGRRACAPWCCIPCMVRSPSSLLAALFHGRSAPCCLAWTGLLTCRLLSPSLLRVQAAAPTL